jgi:hypothetical protein
VSPEDMSVQKRDTALLTNHTGLLRRFLLLWGRGTLAFFHIELGTHP